MKRYDLECVCDFCGITFTELVGKQTYDKYRKEQPIKSICNKCFDDNKK